MSLPMVRIEGLKKNYGPTQALNGLSFSIPRGQVVGLLGPNGAGKSTTMKILAGFLTPSAGSAQVGDVDVTQAPVEARRLIGYLPENNPLYEDMMVVDFLGFIAEVRGIAPDKRTARIRDVVEKCGLGAVVGKDIGQLSKGYRQRVGLAQAIVHDPSLLILDEPTSGLDPNQIVEIRNLIRDLGKEKTVLLSTHILPEVQTTCSRVLIINGGKLVVDDTPDHLSASEGGKVAITVAAKFSSSLDAPAAVQVFSSVAGVSAVEAGPAAGEGTASFVLRYEGLDVRRAVFEKAVASDLVLLEMSRQHVSLEETFRRLTSTEGKS